MSFFIFPGLVLDNRKVLYRFPRKSPGSALRPSALFQDFSWIIKSLVSFFKEKSWIRVTPIFVYPGLFLDNKKKLIMFIQELSWISVRFFFDFPGLVLDNQKLIFLFPRKYPGSAIRCFAFSSTFLDNQKPYSAHPGNALDQR